MSHATIAVGRRGSRRCHVSPDVTAWRAASLCLRRCSRPQDPLLALRALLLAAVAQDTTCRVLALTLTVRNDLPRYDAAGEIVDAHSGSLVQHPNGTYFFYGERYRDATGMDYNWTTDGYAPKLTVY